MAKVKLINTREHPIHLNVNGQTLLIPSKKEDPEDRSKTINGQLMVEAEHVDAAKKHPVARGYFKEGWLRVADEAPKPAPAK